MKKTAYILIFVCVIFFKNTFFCQTNMNKDTLMIKEFLFEINRKQINAENLFDKYFSKDSIIYNNLKRTDKITAYYIHRTLPEMSMDMHKFHSKYKIYSYREAVLRFECSSNSNRNGVLQLDEDIKNYTYIVTLKLKGKEYIWKHILTHKSKILALEYDTDINSILRWW